MWILTKILVKNKGIISKRIINVIFENKKKTFKKTRQLKRDEGSKILS